MTRSRAGKWRQSGQRSGVGKTEGPLDTKRWAALDGGCQLTHFAETRWHDSHLDHWAECTSSCAPADQCLRADRRRPLPSPRPFPGHISACSTANHTYVLILIVCLPGVRMVYQRDSTLFCNHASSEMNHLWLGNVNFSFLSPSRWSRGETYV